jgi:sec-independent protein translocase protein TatA
MGFINIGPLEIAVILIIALLVLGPAKLPETARSVGKGMREFKQSITGERDEDDRALHDEQ